MIVLPVVLSVLLLSTVVAQMVPPKSNRLEATVTVYGATPAGCAAAVAAARHYNAGAGRTSRRVVLIGPSPRVGGMVSGGLGHTDLGMGGRELGGITAEFYSRISAFYGPAPPPNSGQNKSQCFQVYVYSYTAL